MGTRSTITIKDGKTTLVKLYKQFDGYVVDGLGEQLVKFLKPFKIVNGYSMSDKAGTSANGMECLAAQLIAHLKTGIGYVYVVSPRSGKEEYNYVVNVKDGKPTLSVDRDSKELKQLWEAGDKVDPDTLPLVTFIYRKVAFDKSPESQTSRLLRVAEETETHINGYDQNLDGAYRSFLKSKIAGKIHRF